MSDETDINKKNQEKPDNLIKIDKTNENNELTKETQDKINLAYNLKKDGDEQLKAQNFTEAPKSYTKAVITVKHLIKEKLINEETAKKLKNEVLIPSNLNMSVMDIKKKDWDEAIRHCNKVLFVEKNHPKALYRRCTAYIYKGNFKKADEDLFELEDIIGGTKELEELEKLFEVNKKKADGNNGEFLKKMAQKIKGKELFNKENDLNKEQINQVINENYKQQNNKKGILLFEMFDKAKKLCYKIICCRCKRNHKNSKEKLE